MNVQDFLRHRMMPHILCPGCGCGIVLGALIRAVRNLEIDRNKIVVVSGIGCSGRLSGYVDFNTLHTTHGRALAFATGVKLAKPELYVIAIMGDGDAAAIGGNHLIHAARRNVTLTALVINNSIYGMTGGQYSPTTPYGAKASTAPYGHIERGLEICELARAAGAAFVARGTVYHTKLLIKLIERAILKKGFSLIEIISPCPVNYGRRNMMSSAVEMLEWQRRNAVEVERAKTMPAEELRGKIVIGVLEDREIVPFEEEYEKLCERARNEAS